jgi:hypothetical protein
VSDIDMDLVDENYLTPLEWTEDEFNNYLGDTYDMELADFADFEDLEATVGPLIDDITLDNLLSDYGLDEAGLDQILENNGETLDDYYFIYDLESTLDENMPVSGDQSAEDEAAAGTVDSGTNNGDGNDASNNNGEVTKETENGAEMPVTATSAIENIMIGMGVALIGAAALIGRRTRQGEQ